VLLPCNVVVRTIDQTHTLVEAMNPAIMSQLSDNPDVADVAVQALSLITAALATLASGAA
jgi:hypothetical protein